MSDSWDLTDHSLPGPSVHRISQTRTLDLQGIFLAQRVNPRLLHWQEDPLPLSHNAQTIIQLHSLHVTARVCSKSSKLGFNSMWTESFQMFQLSDVLAGFWRGRETRDHITNIHWIMEKARAFQKKTHNSASLITLKPLTVWVTTNCGKFLEMGVPKHLTCLLMKPVCSSRSNS